ncbi:hypothetical protein E2320_012234 [Naja naja]|nr:hypothetical protein E2320_012234 [Naja naja]
MVRAFISRANWVCVYAPTHPPRVNMDCWGRQGHVQFSWGMSEWLSFRKCECLHGHLFAFTEKQGSLYPPSPSCQASVATISTAKGCSPLAVLSSQTSLSQIFPPSSLNYWLARVLTFGWLGVFIRASAPASLAYFLSLSGLFLQVKNSQDGAVDFPGHHPCGFFSLRNSRDVEWQVAKIS